VRSQARPEFGVVVELTVVGDVKHAIGRRHRLMAGCGQIDDCQAAVAKAHRSVDKQPFAVGTAMSDRTGHAVQRPRVNLPKAVAVVIDSGDPAHFVATGFVPRAARTARTLRRQLSASPLAGGSDGRTRGATCAVRATGPSAPCARSASTAASIERHDGFLFTRPSGHYLLSCVVQEHDERIATGSTADSSGFVSTNRIGDPLPSGRVGDEPGWV
jgi:hypothetical protein